MRQKSLVRTNVWAGDFLLNTHIDGIVDIVDISHLWFLADFGLNFFPFL